MKEKTVNDEEVQLEDRIRDLKEFFDEKKSKIVQNLCSI